MSNQLNIGVKFGAEGIPEVNKSISALANQLKRFQQGLNTATGVDSIARLNRAIEGTKKQMLSLQQFTGSTGGSLSGPIVQGANQAGNALTNLSRIAQDAPFGFIGIQNNINPLLESFQRLKAETGSTGGALKALGSSLLGAGGLGLAVSLATSAFTLFSMSSRGAKAEVAGFGKAMSEANKEAGEEIANLRVLAAVAANTTNSVKDRKAATIELQKALKENNVQLSQEKILNNEAAQAIDIATQAILSRAKARAVENRIAELSGENLDREFKRKELTDRLAISQKKLTEETEKANKSGRLLISSIQGRGAQIEVERLTDQIADLGKESTKATEEIDFLLTQATATGKASGGGDAVVDLLKRRIEALKELQSIAGLTQGQQVELTGLEITLAKRDAVKAGFTKQELQDLINGIIEKAFPGQSEFEISPSLSFKIDSSNIVKPDVNKLLGLDQISQSDLDKAMERIRAMAEVSANARKELLGLTEVQEQMKSLNDTLTEIAKNFAVEAITSVTEGLANLISGVAEGQSVFRGLFNLIAGAAVQLGKAFLAYGLAMEGFKIAIGTLNGVAAIAAGVGLILAGSLLKASIPKFADGVNNFGGGFAIVGERGPELVNLPRGSDVIPNHMLNQGGTPIILQPSLKVQGKEIMVMLQQVSNSNNRMGGATL